VPVAVTDFDESRIPSHLRMSFAVIDERSRTVASGTDLRALQEQLASTVRESVARASITPRSNLERGGLTAWDFEELPRTLDTKQGGNTIRAYPALVDEGASVAIRLMTMPDDQAREQRRGVRRMLLLAIPSPVSYVQDHLTQTEKLTLAQSPYRTTAELFADCMAVCIDAVVAGREVWTRAEFEAVRDEISATIMDSLFQAVSLLTQVITGSRNAEKAIKAASNIAMLSPLADAREQLSALVYPGFASDTGLTQLRRLPVYLAGIVHRIGKLGENLGRDRVWMTEVQTATARYELAGGRLPPTPDSAVSIVRARWLLEELRLSLFAQHLGTAEPVSLQRIVRVLSSL
jgi:ATP-dependent helicase HrpA